MSVKTSCAGLALLEVVLLGAAAISPWEKKDFKDWTTEDAQLIMRKSPWAKEMPMPVGGRPGVTVMDRGETGAPPPSSALGNPSNTTSGANMAAAGNPGSAGPADPTGTHNLPTPRAVSAATSTGAPEPQSGLTVVWASSKPIRLAVLRLRSGANVPPDSEVERVTKVWPDYVIAVAGLPAPGDGELDAAKLKDNAFLAVKNKAAVVATRSDYRKIGNSDVYFFHFPKATLPITASDRQVEFKMKMNKIEVKKRFDLGEMMFQGELSL